MKTIVRETKETRVELGLAPGGTRVQSDTGDPFLDHMMATFAFYAGLDLVVAAKGDLRHHLVEDVAITAGEALARIVPARSRRYGGCTLPMDDALVQVALDLGGRPWYEGPLPAKLYDHWFRSFAMQSRATLHVRVLRGTDRHHVVEAGFKALGMSVRDALAESGALFSTKGAVRWEEGEC